MKKITSLLVLTVLLVATLLTACGGGNEETYNNITAEKNPYSMGTQSITIVASFQNPDEPTAKFKQSISASDVELGQALEGKTVTKVVYNSENSITVTLDGNTKTQGGEGVYGSITVKQSGMESKGRSTCVVNVRAPEINVVYYNSTTKIKDGVTTYSVTAKLELPVGSFTNDATDENVSLQSGANGELSVRLSDGLLIVTVKNCDKKSPSIILNPSATTFNKQITVALTMGASTTIR